MKIVLQATIQYFGEAGYIGYIDGLKGLVVQGETIEQTWKELILSLKIKMIHDLGLDISILEQQDEITVNFPTENKSKEINLTLA